MTNKEEIQKSFEHVKYINEYHEKLCSKYIARARRVIPYSKLSITKYNPASITEFGIKFYNENYWLLSKGDSDDEVLKWKYVNMTDEEFEEELIKVEKEKKDKEIAELECKISKLKNG